MYAQLSYCENSDDSLEAAVSSELIVKIVEFLYVSSVRRRANSAPVGYVVKQHFSFSLCFYFWRLVGFIYRTKMAEMKIHQMLWKIDHNDIIIVNSATNGAVSVVARIHIAV